MSVRCKFRLSMITTNCWNPASKTLRFEAIYESSVPEDRRFAKATPSGHIEITVDNPVALERFDLGKFYYLDFSPCREA